MTDTTESSIDAAPLTISVIAVDRPGLLAVALDDLAAQAPRNATLQILLNACGAETAAVAGVALEGWPGPTRLLETAERLPFAEAHNVALAAVETPLVNFMSDDDVSFGDRLNRQVAFLADNPDVLAVGTFAYRIGGREPGDIRKGGRMDLGPVSREECRATLESGGLIYFTFPSVVARVAALRAVGGLHPQFGVAADVDLWTRLAEQGPVLSIPEHLFGFRIHDGSASTTRFAEQRRLTRYAKACAAARREGRPEPPLNDLDEGGPLARLAFRLKTASLYNFRRAGAAWVEGRKARALWRLAKSVLLWPPSGLGKLIEQLGRRV